MEQDTFKHLWKLLNPQGEYVYREKICQQLWSSFDLEKQRAIYFRIRGKLQRGEQVSPNPYYALQHNMDPEPPKLTPPKNYNHTADFLTIVKTGTLVSAEYNGEVGIYTEADAQKHSMTILRHFKP